MNRWERVLDGEGQVALIIGEAGIGKSRLVQRFHEQIAATPHTWVEAAAGAILQNTPFYPVTEMLKQALAWRSDEPSGATPRAIGVRARTGRTQACRSYAAAYSAAESAAIGEVSNLMACHPSSSAAACWARWSSWRWASPAVQPTSNGD